MQNNYRGSKHSLGTRIFLGFIFGFLVVPAFALDLILDPICFAMKLNKPICSCTKFCTSAVVDCVEGENIGTNLDLEDIVGSVTSKITQAIGCFLMSFVSLAIGGGLGYLSVLLAIAGMSAGTVIFPIIGAFLGLCGGILLIASGCKKIADAKKVSKKKAEIEKSFENTKQIKEVIQNKPLNIEHKKGLTDILTNQKLSEKDKKKIFSPIYNYNKKKNEKVFSYISKILYPYESNNSNEKKTK